MSEPISVGDLVMVVRSCCEKAAQKEAGLIRVVLEIGFNSDGESLQTKGCLCVHGEWQPIAKIEPTGWHPTAWLKRLDPDALKDDVPTKEELTA